MTKAGAWSPERIAVLAEHDVAGLEVAVEHAPAVGVGHGVADIDQAAAADNVLGVAGLDFLEGHLAVQLQVLGDIDLPRPTLGVRPQDAMMPPERLDTGVNSS
jgi:hypothetical protein